MTRLQDFAAQALQFDAQRHAVEFEGRWRTWGEFRDIASRVSALLAAGGAHPQAPVVLAPRNRPSVLAAFLALTAEGRNIRMIYVYQSPGGMVRDILKAKPAAFIAPLEDFSVDVVTALRAEGILGVALTDDDAIVVEGCERAAADVELGPAEPQIQVLTSGTTGPPKLFAFSYDLIAQHMVSTNSVVGGADDAATLTPMFLFFPLGGSSGIYATLPVLLRGIRGVLVDRFTLGAWRDYVVRYRPAWAGAPASAVQMILDAEVPAEELASLRAFSPAAAPVPLAAHRAFEARYGIPILLAYGATEFGGPVAMMTPELQAEWGPAKVGSVGRPYLGAQLRVVDAETGALLPAGREGLLEVQAPRIGDQWIRTADVGLIDEDGFIFHRGRADGAIMRGGFKLLPETIEQALLKHPAVSAVSAVGVADARVGEVPVAAIRLRPGVCEPTPEALERHAREHLPATHIPTRWTFVDTLPVNHAMKVDRAAVRRLFETPADG
jgi:acyl-coenzyme A synthetase/AMP-(fatty) acid ligase